jgi:glycosyltransferase involved in cell wall biosynthesis
MAERPLRVLHVITRLIVGGAQENTLLTAIGQRRRGMTVALVAGPDPGPEGDLHDAARDAGIELHLVPALGRPIHPLKDVLALVELVRFMKRGRFDVVHTHSSKGGILGRVAARIAGVPIVIHTLHGLVFHEYQAAWKNRLYVRLKKICAPLCDVLIAVNQKTIDGAIAAGIGRHEQYVKVFSGIPLGPFLDVAESMTPAQAKESLGIPGSARVVGKIARLFPLKGHDQFFDAAETIARRDASCWFLLVGGGILRSQLEERARRLGIAERTVFAGLVPPEDVPRYIQAMDVVVHTSLREGIARVIPQAGAVGKPVVTFDLDGAPEVIESGVSGYLVPAGDCQGIAERTLELLEKPDLRRAMGARGRAFAAEHYPAERMVEAIEAIYGRFFDRLDRLDRSASVERERVEAAVRSIDENGEGPGAILTTNHPERLVDEVRRDQFEPRGKDRSPAVH